MDENDTFHPARDELSSLLQTCREEYIVDSFKSVDQIVNFDWNWIGLCLNKALPFSLVEACIDEPWDWTALSCHPSLTWTFVSKHMNKPWNWSILSSHQIVTCEIVLENLDIDWSWSEMSFNRNMTWEFVYRFWFKPWDWDALSSHIKIDVATIGSAYFMPWSWDNLCYNSSFIIDIVKIRKELNLFEAGYSLLSHEESKRYVHLTRLWDFIIRKSSAFHWSIMSNHQCLNIDMLNDSKEIPWDFHSFLYNPSLAWNHVKYCCHIIGKYRLTSEHASNESYILQLHVNQDDHFGNGNDLDEIETGNEEFISNLTTFSQSICIASLIPLSIALSCNKNIPLDTILSVLERHERHESSNLNTSSPRPRPFDTWEISKRDDFNLYFLERLLQLSHHQHVLVCWPAISKNTNFTWEIIKMNLHLPWCWYSVSSNPNITMEIVDSNQNYPWSWSGLSCNPNLSLMKLKAFLSNTIFERRLSPIAVSAHINFDNLEDSDIDTISQMYVRRASRDVSYLLAMRQTGNLNSRYKKLYKIVENFRQM